MLKYRYIIGHIHRRVSHVLVAQQPAISRRSPRAGGQQPAHPLRSVTCHMIPPFEAVTINGSIVEMMEAHTDESTSTTQVTANQLPLMSNNATTGHKLQGCSHDTVCVPDWNCSLNWPHAQGALPFHPESACNL